MPFALEPGQIQHDVDARGVFFGLRLRRGQPRRRGACDARDTHRHGPRRRGNFLVHGARRCLPGRQGHADPGPVQFLEALGGLFDDAHGKFNWRAGA